MGSGPSINSLGMACVCGCSHVSRAWASGVAGKPVTWEVERVIAAVGYRPDLSVCTELRVGEPPGKIETDEPGYFVLGAKSRGRDSNFLLADRSEEHTSELQSH